MSKVTWVGNNLTIEIPEEFLVAHGLNEGSEVEIIPRDHEIVITTLGSTALVELPKSVNRPLAHVPMHELEAELRRRGIDPKSAK